MELAECTANKMEYKKDMKDWTENSSRIYLLVLLHCPPGLIAELQNHSRWIDGKALQDYIALLLMIRGLAHGMKETRQGTMALVQVHVDLFTTTQRPNKSVEAYYKLFCARRNTVNVHGGEAGFHKELYAKAREKVMAKRNHDETFMAIAAGDANILVAVTAIKKNPRKFCCDQFLAALFLKMADDGRYEIPKTKLNNDFLFGDYNAPLTVVKAKRVLSDYTVTVNSKADPDANEGDDGIGLAFAETQEWVKTATCYGCGRKGHLLSNCKKTPTERKKAIYAMVKKATSRRPARAWSR